MRKQYSSWKRGFEESFPLYPEGDNKLARDAFLKLVYLNFKNHKNRRFDDPASEFARFYEWVKKAKPRAHEAMIFSLWLYLCIARPWRETDFLAGWRMHWSVEVQVKIWDILEKLRDKKFDLTIPQLHLNKGFSSYERDEAVRMYIRFYTWGAEHSERLRQLVLKYRFLRLVKSGSVITKREIQKKLHISTDQINAWIDEEKKHGTIQTIEKPCNSLWIIWKGPQGSRVHK
ncbi:MAG: hypothetical protein WBC70_14665 [Candidatus Aminicenantales bacterium]